MKNVTNEEIKELLMELGCLLPKGFVWSGELRKKFEKITTFLSKS